MPQSIYDNGGMIGATLDFGSTERYIIGTTTGRATPVYVGGTTAAGPGSAGPGTVSLTSLTGGIGTAPQQGDLILVAYAIGSTTDVNVSISMNNSTDVVELVDLYANDTVDTNLGVYWAIAGVTPPTTITAGGTGSTANAGALAVHVWRDIDTTTPMDDTRTTATGTNSASANPPAISTATENAVVIAIGASGNDNETTPFTQGGDLSNFISIGGSDTEDATVGMGSIATTTPTTVDPAAFSISTSISYSWAAATVALRPKLVDIPIYGNFKNSGIWSLLAVLDTRSTATSAIGFVGAATGSTSISLTSLTGGTRSAAAAGDFVLVVSGQGIDTGTTNNIDIVGYTNIANLVSTSTVRDDLFLDVGYKYLTSADTSVSITNGVASVAYVFSGVSQSNPLDVTSTTSLTGTVSVSPPAITPVTAGSWIISAVGIGSDTNNAVFSNTTMSGTRGATGARTHVAMAYNSTWTSGAYTPAGWSTNDPDGTGAGAAVTIALRKA